MLGISTALNTVPVISATTSAIAWKILATHTAVPTRICGCVKPCEAMGNPTTNTYSCKLMIVYHLANIPLNCSRNLINIFPLNLAQLDRQSYTSGRNFPKSSCLTVLKLMLSSPASTFKKPSRTSKKTSLLKACASTGEERLHYHQNIVQR